LIKLRLHLIGFNIMDPGDLVKTLLEVLLVFHIEYTLILKALKLFPVILTFTALLLIVFKLFVKEGAPFILNLAKVFRNTLSGFLHL
jgi:hypothetical protein